MFDGITGTALLDAGSKVLGSALAPSSAGPSRAESSLWQNTSFDNSGWTVSTGSSKATGGARGIDLNQWAIVAMIALGAIAWVRGKKR